MKQAKAKRPVMRFLFERVKIFSGKREIRKKAWIPVVGATGIEPVTPAV